MIISFLISNNEFQCVCCTKDNSKQWDNDSVNESFNKNLLVAAVVTVTPSLLMNQRRTNGCLWCSRCTTKLTCQNTNAFLFQCRKSEFFSFLTGIAFSDT